MFDHLGVNVADLARSLKFYDAALAPLGVRRMHDGDGWAIYGRTAGEAYLWVGSLRPSYWSAEHHITPIHVSIRAPSEEAVRAFHGAALAAGGRDFGAPGPRPYAPGYYAAFVLDPDGHNVEATSRS